MNSSRRFLIPKALKSHGMTRAQVSINKAAVAVIVDRYAREAGVRGLENNIKKIMRKAAMEFAEGRVEKVRVTKHDIEHYLGKPIFAEEELLKNAPGVVTGLAWTRMGGATLQIEATAMKSKTKGFKQTGQLGDVMVESSEIAYSYVMGHLQEYKIPEDYFDTHFIHLHVPAGATPKDGPSAGVTMTTALLSMIMNKPVREKLGMTGELSLTGSVLPIGGVKEKTIAARRAGLTALIFPHENKDDYEDLADYLREGIEVHFVKEYPDVFKIAFADNT